MGRKKLPAHEVKSNAECQSEQRAKNKRLFGEAAWNAKEVKRKADSDKAVRAFEDEDAAERRRLKNNAKSARHRANKKLRARALADGLPDPGPGGPGAAAALVAPAALGVAGPAAAPALGAPAPAVAPAPPVEPAAARPKPPPKGRGRKARKVTQHLRVSASLFTPPPQDDTSPPRREQEQVDLLRRIGIAELANVSIIMLVFVYSYAHNIYASINVTVSPNKIIIKSICFNFVFCFVIHNNLFNISAAPGWCPWRLVDGTFCVQWTSRATQQCYLLHLLHVDR